MVPVFFGVDSLVVFEELVLDVLVFGEVGSGEKLFLVVDGPLE